MPARALNEEFLVGNTCFGCGLENPEGLQIRIYRDGERDDRLVGRYAPRPTHAGFPFIVHGGVQFTALDCMAGWMMFILRSPGRMMPLTTSATMRFLRPVLTHEPLALEARVTRAGASPREPVLITAEVKNGAGEVLSSGEFEYVLLPVEKFLKAVGTAALPDTYVRHFGLAQPGGAPGGQ